MTRRYVYKFARAGGRAVAAALEKKYALEAEPPTIFHRRQRLRRRGGNQFYRDYSVRKTATVCGAPVTEFDCGWRDKAEDWTRPSDGRRFVYCPECRDR